jgi:hypothetical protein
MKEGDHLDAGELIANILSGGSICWERRAVQEGRDVFAVDWRIASSCGRHPTSAMNRSCAFDLHAVDGIGSLP